MSGFETNGADAPLLAFGTHYLGCVYCSPGLASPLEYVEQLCYRGRRLWADLTGTERAALLEPPEIMSTARPHPARL